MLQDLSEKDTQTFHKCYAILHDHVGGNATIASNNNTKNNSKNANKSINNQAIRTNAKANVVGSNNESSKHNAHGTSSDHNVQQQPVTPHNSANMHVPLDTPRRY